jgi:hypothetical protein
MLKAHYHVWYTNGLDDRRGQNLRLFLFAALLKLLEFVTPTLGFFRFLVQALTFVYFLLLWRILKMLVNTGLVIVIYFLGWWPLGRLTKLSFRLTFKHFSSLVPLGLGTIVKSVSL